MSRKINLWENPYGNGNIFEKKSIVFNPGVTVLVGCNGIGKTTLINNIISSLKEEKIPYISFDNLRDGGDEARRKALNDEVDYGFVATSMCSSEGENIAMNIGKFAFKIGQFIRYGKKNDRLSELVKIISGNVDEEVCKSNERWILFDAIDSGLSIDNIDDVKELFTTILSDNMDKDVYIIVSANGYEIADNENCLDVVSGKFLRFFTYDEYKEFILETSREKERRMNRSNM